jgi:hypothetical protein
MDKPTAASAAPRSKSLYPAQQQQQQQPLMTEDERMARTLQAQYDRERLAGPPVVAQPAFQPMDLPFNCGHCGMAHVVRHAAPNTVFQCTQCGRQNQIAIQGSRAVVIARSRVSWIPIPIICSIQ